MSPTGDFILHVIIVLIELWAFVTVFKIIRNRFVK
jgi:hypothetical protein